MLSDQGRNALEWLRENRDRDYIASGGGFETMRNMFIVVNDVLRIFRADDDEPVTEEWVRSVGGVPSPYSSDPTLLCLAGFHVTFYAKTGIVRAGVETIPPTRGHVRLACAAFGMPLEVSE